MKGLRCFQGGRLFDQSLRVVPFLRAKRRDTGRSQPFVVGVIA